MSTSSFPYLAIAREHGIPYGAVIRIAEALPVIVVGSYSNLDYQTIADYAQYHTPVLMMEIAGAIVAERERRQRVVELDAQLIMIGEWKE